MEEEIKEATAREYAKTVIYDCEEVAEGLRDGRGNEIKGKSRLYRNDRLLMLVADFCINNKKFELASRIVNNEDISTVCARHNEIADTCASIWAEHIAEAVNKLREWQEDEGTTIKTNSETNKDTAKVSQPQQLSERAKKYFSRAVEADYMEETDTGYIWKFNEGKKICLAYFLKRIYNPDGTGKTPFKFLESLFSVRRLDRSTAQLLETKVEQKWKGEIDKLFDD